MKRLVALALAAVPAIAWGDLEFIPKWHMCGNEACYGFEDAKKLVLLDGQLKLAAAQAKALEDLKLANAELQAAAAKKEAALQLNTQAAQDLKAKLETCIDQRAAAEVKAASGPSLGWLVAGGVTLILVGVLVGHYTVN